MPQPTPLLDTIETPADTRGLSIPDLRQLADELRAETIDAVSVTGGHLDSFGERAELLRQLAAYVVARRQ